MEFLELRNAGGLQYLRKWTNSLWISTYFSGWKWEWTNLVGSENINSIFNKNRWRDWRFLSILSVFKLRNFHGWYELKTNDEFKHFRYMSSPWNILEKETPRHAVSFWIYVIFFFSIPRYNAILSWRIFQSHEVTVDTRTKLLSVLSVENNFLTQNNFKPITFL